MTPDDSRVEVLAPISGWVSQLGEVPDPAFAERLVGDGLAVDPTGSSLHAPFDGEIVSMPETRHAVAVRADGGAELLMHIGLETVGLAGEGFVAHVGVGQRVRGGDKLISFDLDLLARRAKSVITPVVLTNGGRFDIVLRHQDRRVRVGEPLMALASRQSGEVSASTGDTEARGRVVLAFAHGLHARPAASVAQVAQRFEAEVVVRGKNQPANAKSTVALMTAGLRAGDAVEVEARGVDAETAVSAVVSALSAPEPTTPHRPPPTRVAVSTTAAPGEIRGVCAAPGRAIGVATRVAARRLEVSETGAGADVESAQLDTARARARSKLDSAADAAGDDAERRSIMVAHASLIDDPDIVADARRIIAQGKSAGFAWRAAVSSLREQLVRLGDRYMAEREADLADVEHQVLLELVGPEAGPIEDLLPDDAILIAEELLPSQLSALDATKVAGLCTAGGGPTSHAAIIAASMGVPAIVAAGPEVMTIQDGVALVINADEGVLRVAPPPTELAEACGEMERRQRAAHRAHAEATEDCCTSDGTRIQVYANLTGAEEAPNAVALGAEGCGLLRTELLFQDREHAPTVEEQRDRYQAVSDGLDGRPLVIRTLDIGGDKPVPFLPLPVEENPALGLRGLRASLTRPELLQAQLTAIGRVTPSPRVMLPMVTAAEDIERVRSMSEASGLKLGAMVETPSSAMLADQIASVADFLSIGTNDLAQYTLAMDRGHPALAAAIDALHPAVLRLVARVIDGAHPYRCPVSVCGGAASDPLAAPVLIGLGIRSLSAAPAAVPAIKACVRPLRLDECEHAARSALAQTNAEQVRALARERFGHGER